MWEFPKPIYEVPGLPNGVYFHRTGSSVIGGATPESDEDIVVIYDPIIHACLIDNGYQSSYDVNLDGLRYPNTSVVECYRKDKFNIIAVTDQAALDRWEKYTALACIMGLTTKNQRVCLAQFITEGLVRGTHVVY